MRLSQSEIEIITSKVFELGLRSGWQETSLQGVQREAVEVVRQELTKAGVAIQQKRHAIVEVGSGKSGVALLAVVSDYLPGNYEAFLEECVDASVEPYIEIEGYDRAGWTLDDYVIPRLASGLICAKERD
tara:strand:- start:5344 stop:5733 length:390 start_codon:yes stop_codon:yes gene_type:complete